ncbi:hypothetical protein ZOSMA_209G00020 [Zostera marina]|uniref:Uncharacterized protein n=1 Tax=Zostera marina TaxID=29655 RepID=A0A0K9PL49_ZOSMR|nr:hypothetical protein ZOSMA_209G00020 [Zostera marina]
MKIDERNLAFHFIILLMVVSSSGDWVDYPSGVRCCSYIQVERCDPLNADANFACRDVCHYGGCSKGGQCEEGTSDIGTTDRFCHCNC